MASTTSVLAGSIGLSAGRACLQRLAGAGNGVESSAGGVVWDGSTPTFRRSWSPIPGDAQTAELAEFEDYCRAHVPGSLIELFVPGEPGFGRNAIRGRDSFISSPKSREVLGDLQTDVVEGSSSIDGGTGYGMFMGSQEVMKHRPDFWNFTLPPWQARRDPLTPIPALSERQDFVTRWVAQDKGSAVVYDPDWMTAVGELGTAEASALVREGGYEGLATANVAVADQAFIGQALDDARFPLLELFTLGFEGTPWTRTLPRHPDSANLLRLMAGKWVCLTQPFKPMGEVPSAQEILRHAVVPMTDFRETSYMVVVGALPSGFLASAEGGRMHRNMVDRFFEETGKPVEVFLVPREQIHPSENRWWGAIFQSNPPKFVVEKIKLLEGG